MTDKKLRQDRLRPALEEGGDWMDNMHERKKEAQGQESVSQQQRCGLSETSCDLDRRLRGHRAAASRVQHDAAPQEAGAGTRRNVLPRRVSFGGVWLEASPAPAGGSGCTPPPYDFSFLSPQPKNLHRQVRVCSVAFHHPPSTTLRVPFIHSPSPHISSLSKAPPRLAPVVSIAPLLHCSVVVATQNPFHATGQPWPTTLRYVPCQLRATRRAVIVYLSHLPLHRECPQN
jgi:hypothetical protein